MNRNVIKTLAIVNGFGKMLTAISILCFIVFLILCFISGFTDWRKDYLIFSIIGMVAFWIIARVSKYIIRKMEN